MTLLQRSDIQSRLGSAGGDALYIDPLLEQSQIGTVTVDLRLGPDFLVSLLTRKSSIEIAALGQQRRDIGSYFRTTRRDLGDRFILYPNQVVLATTLEYIGLPGDVFVDILSRSSYSRLGIHLNTTVQPGFRGVIPLELVNHGNNPVELVVGSRIVQARFHALAHPDKYQSGQPNRKYYGDVRPVVSRAQEDPDLAVLSRI